MSAARREHVPCLRSSIALSLAVAVLASCLAVPDGASAQSTGYRGWFTFRGSNCAGSPIDPLNVLWYRSTDASFVVRNEVRGALGWNKTTDAGEQNFYTGGECRPDAGGLRKGNDFSYHTRFFVQPHRTPGGNQAVFGDAHVERKVECRNRDGAKTGKRTHAVYQRTPRTRRSGFDQAALDVLRAFENRGHTRSETARGPNRMVFRQCDQSEVMWNGRQYHIKLR